MFDENLGASSRITEWGEYQSPNVAFGWNGTGGFVRAYSWVADKASAINITASRMDADTNDVVSNGLQNCLTRDGQGIPSSNISWNNFKITGLNTGSARSDSINLGQVQDGLQNWVAAGGTADAITATYSPAITALVDGQVCYVRAASANATTTPSFSPNGLTTHTITKFGGQSLAPGDIPGAAYEMILRYNLANTRWEYLNPATSMDWDGHCQLRYVSASQIKLVPFNGTTVPLKRNGIWTNYSIGAGITGFSTAGAGALVNGASATPTTGTLYYVYLWDNAGSPVLDYSTTAYATDAATGIRIKSGDATRTLVGMFQLSGGSFVQSFGNGAVWQVRSWFNRDKPAMQSSGISGGVPTQVSYTVINGNLTHTALIWADETLYYDLEGSCANTTAGAQWQFAGFLDSVAINSIVVHTPNANYSADCSFHWQGNVAEGQHSIGACYVLNANSGTVTMYAYAQVR